MVNIWSRIVRSFYPARCLLCAAPGPDCGLCAGCLTDLPWLRHACSRCALPLDSETALCGGCLRRPPPFTASLALFRYAWPADRLLTAFKYGQRFAAGRTLGELLARRAAAAGQRPQALLPVPLHPARLRQRGFNQARELARHIAGRLEIPVADGLCARVRATPQQASLDARTRRRNLRGAFRVLAPPPRHLVLIDDVMTTGSTARELTLCLQRAGAERVDVWCVARAV